MNGQESISEGRVSVRTTRDDVHAMVDFCSACNPHFAKLCHDIEFEPPEVTNATCCAGYGRCGWLSHALLGSRTVLPGEAIAACSIPFSSVYLVLSSNPRNQT